MTWTQSPGLTQWKERGHTLLLFLSDFMISLLLFCFIFWLLLFLPSKSTQHHRYMFGHRAQVDSWGFIHEENWISLSQGPSIANSFSARSETLWPPSSSRMGICLSWFCSDIILAVSNPFSCLSLYSFYQLLYISCVQIPCCVSKGLLLLSLSVDSSLAWRQDLGMKTVFRKGLVTSMGATILCYL